MTFPGSLKAAKAALQEHQRLFVRALSRELKLEDNELDEIAELFIRPFKA